MYKIKIKEDFAQVCTSISTQWGDGVENKEDFAQCGGGEGGGKDQGGAQDTPYIFIVRGARMEPKVAINWWVRETATKTCTFLPKIWDVFEGKGKLSKHIYVNCRIYIQFLKRPVRRKYSKICVN